MTKSADKKLADKRLVDSLIANGRTRLGALLDDMVVLLDSGTTEAKVGGAVDAILEKHGLKNSPEDVT